jgi:hypothetical protein
MKYTFFKLAKNMCLDLPIISQADTDIVLEDVYTYIIETLVADAFLIAKEDSLNEFDVNDYIGYILQSEAFLDKVKDVLTDIIHYKQGYLIFVVDSIYDNIIELLHTFFESIRDNLTSNVV